MDPEPYIGSPAPEPEYQPPDAGLPSPWIYRGALLALGVATAVTAYLLIDPPESKSKQDEPKPAATPTPATGSTATPTQPGTGQTRTPTPTLAISQTPTATPGGTNSGGRPYTVQPGDTLSGIATANGTTVEAILAANPGLTENLQIGQQIRIPSP
ncbi:MAG: LysM peptidoglycan-binding domain-containing protein [Dehalococcoidia bacterium]